MTKAGNDRVLLNKANQKIESFFASQTANHAWFGMSASQAKAMYQKLYGLGAILQCHYAVYLQDIYHIDKKGGAIWFDNRFPLSYLATDVEVSLGELDSESFYAGTQQFNYMTQQPHDTIEVTFIETKNMAISKSYQYLKSLTMPNDGSAIEPKRYTFAIHVNVFGDHRNLRSPNLDLRWLVAVKSANFALSSTGRSEIIKVNVTFQKIRPYAWFKNSVPF